MVFLDLQTNTKMKVLVSLSHIVICYGAILLCSVKSFKWEDEDSVVLESYDSNLHLRRGGKFPFRWPWENSFNFNGRARSGDNIKVGDHEVVDLDDFLATCYSTFGEEGRCMEMKACYPMLYVESTNPIENSSLAETLKSISGPCDMPHLNQFRINLPDSLICCPSRLAYQESTSSTTIKPIGKIPKKPTSKPGSTTKPSTKPPEFSDAVAAYYHRDTMCGFLNESYSIESESGKQQRYPWIVALAGNRGHFCGGSLIDRYHVLTAANCVNRMTSDDVSNIQVYLGDYKLNTVTDGPTIVRKVSRIIFHRGFNEQTLENDIALLRFKLPAPSHHRVLPACLPQKSPSTNNNVSNKKRKTGNTNKNIQTQVKQSDELEGSEVILAGWGRSWNHSPVPTLQNTKMTIWSNEDCRKKYGYLARNGISDGMICAFPPREERSDDKDSEIKDCIGDSGGPLVHRSARGTYDLVGITSWNIGCHRYPYVYTRVSNFLNWIEKNRNR